jgi:hypothetical protein
LSDLRKELGEERARVDALKDCLEQEREKTAFLMAFEPAAGTVSVAAAAAASSPSASTAAPASVGFKHDWIVFQERRFSSLELQRTQLARECQRLRQLNARLSEEVSVLRGQLRNSGAVAASKSFEHVYMQDLEAKVR